MARDSHGIRFQKLEPMFGEWAVLFIVNSNFLFIHKGLFDNDPPYLKIFLLKVFLIKIFLNYYL